MDQWVSEVQTGLMTLEALLGSPHFYLQLGLIILVLLLSWWLTLRLKRWSQARMSRIFLLFQR